MSGKILNYNFNILLSGVFVKSLGSGMYSIGAMMLVLFISGDPLYSGVSFFAVSLPACFSFLIAPFANYVPYKKALIVCEWRNLFYLCQYQSYIYSPCCMYLQLFSLCLLLR